MIAVSWIIARKWRDAAASVHFYAVSLHEYVELDSGFADKIAFSHWLSRLSFNFESVMTGGTGGKTDQN